MGDNSWRVDEIDRHTQEYEWAGKDWTTFATVLYSYCCGSSSSFTDLYSAEELKILLAAAEVRVEGGMSAAVLLRYLMFVVS